MTAPRTRSSLLTDALHFAVEQARRLDGLASVEPDEQLLSHWRQAAGVTRKITALLRRERERDRRRRAAEARAARIVGGR